MNKKFISLVFAIVTFLGTVTSVILYPTVNLSAADLSEMVWITSITYDKDDYGSYTVTATVSGESAIITTIKSSGSAVLNDCTLAPRAKDKGVLEYIGSIQPDENNGVTVTFQNLATSIRENELIFMIYTPDGSMTLSKKFNIKELRSESSTPSLPDPDEDEDKPIAALKPHLIVDGYSYGQAVAGQDVPLTFTLKNTSKSKTMRNIVLNVKPAGDLRIKSSSDTIYIDSVDPGETVTKTLLFSLGAAAKEEVQIVGLTSTFEYFDIEDENAAQGGDTVSISIPTDTLERVKIQKVELPEMLYPNMEEEIAYSVINSGFSTLYNAEVKVVDEAGTEYADVYIGSIEPSKAITEPYLSIILPEAGEKNLKFVLSYENDKLQTQEVSKDFKATVMEMPVDKPPIIEEPMPGEPLPEDQAKTPWLMWALIGGGVLVAIIVLVVVIKVVRKKRREREDEDI